MQRGRPWPPDLTRRLPVEILAMIFHYCKDSCRSNRHGLGADWVCTTWVCRRWREVALETAALWSSVLISRRITDDTALHMQLDRAQGSALDLFVSNPQMSSDEVEDVFELVLAKKSSIKKLKVVCVEYHPAIKEFIWTVAADVVSLSVDIDTPEFYGTKWPFTSDVFPRLRRLALCTIIPTRGAPLLNLTQLELSQALGGDTQPRGISVHRFLAACPNLEVLRTDNCFEYAVDDMIAKDVLPVVTLPKLGFLSMNELGLDIATAVGTMRLPALSTFHLTGGAINCVDYIEFFVIPQNISEALPPIRRSRCLSLVAGGSMNDVILKGGPDPLCPDPDDGSRRCQWSITLPDLDDMKADWEPSALFFNPYCIGSITGCFLARIPHLVVPSSLVRLQLHVSNGLPVARDWARFFAAMPRLRALGVGSGALLRLVLAAFEADAGLCPALEDLEFCVGAGLDAEEGLDLAASVMQALGAWARGHAMPLRTLTVHRRPDPEADGSDSDDSDLDSRSSSDSERSDGAGSGRDAESTSDPASKLCDDVRRTLKAFVGKVSLVGTDCPACDVEYEPVNWDIDAIQYGELADGVAYY